MVTIFGGGISGLTAAFALHRRGVPFELFEASDRLGGLIRTERVGDLVIDAGPDGMLARKPAGIRLCEALGIAHRLVPSLLPRQAFVVRGGRLQPLQPPPWHAAEGEPGSRASADVSIAEFFRARFSSEALDYFAEPVLAGIHAGDVARLSMPALFPDLLGGAARGREPDPQGEFRSFAGGLQELTDALVQALPRTALRAGMPAPEISVRLARGPVIVAVPAHAAAGLFAPLDPGLADLCRSIPHVSSGIVVLAYPRDAVRHPLEGSGFVVPRAEPGFGILAATWLSSKWPGRAPAGVALLRAFFGGARDPGAVARPDAPLIEMAHRDLSALLDIDTSPTFSRVYKWIDGTPQYEVGYLARLGAIRDRLARHAGLFAIGAGFGTIGIPDCIEGAMKAAAAIE